MRTPALKLPVVALVMVFGNSVTAADLSGVVKGCAICHGPEGVSTRPEFPTIAGIPAGVHADALYLYKEGGYPCPDSKMCKPAVRLSDEQIEQIAEYYAAKPFVAAKQDFDADKAARGEEIHNADCEKCHTGGGSNPEVDASILAGQWMMYLTAVMTDYAAGKRLQNDAMKAKTEKLSEADIEALVNYYASQH